MRKNLIRYGMLLFFAVMAAAMLLESRLAASLALEGLSLWFSGMIPALLPFMILSGLLMELGLSDSFAALFAPVLRPILRLSDPCMYCVVVGFLCGFPMGARVCAQSYEAGKLSRREATLLLAFCNNIGPVYFTGYVLRLFPSLPPLRAVLIMYGLPFFYGVLLRYTLFRAIPAPNGDRRAARTPKNNRTGRNDRTGTEAARLTPERVLLALNSSVQSGLNAVTLLGGYMIFCNLLNLFPRLLLPQGSRLSRLIGPALEITGGLSKLPADEAVWALAMLPLGGLSCIAQTCSCLHGTDLSLKEYLFHKTVQTMLTLACCDLLL